MIEWLMRKKTAPIHVLPGDMVELRYVDGDGRAEFINCKIVDPATYDTFAIGRIENELGFAEGLVAVVGNSEQGADIPINSRSTQR